jgi:uncharacterized protein (UPF0548 family)
MHDRPLWSTPVTYGAIGATQSADLLRYPPAGYRAVERRARIGHGTPRWEFAWPETLSWGIMARSGFRIDLVESPVEVVENSYVAVSYDESGAPVPAADSSGERVFASSGRELVRPGDSAVLSLPGWRLLGIREPVRVIYLVDEPRRKGFAYGTLAGHPLRGEELFVVERHDDDSVWLAVRYFARPANRWWWAVYPLVRLGQAIMLRRYLRALAVPLATA